MAIKRFNDYEKTQAYGEIQQLPKGAYILKVLGVDLNENSVGQYITLHCDVLEGEHKDFFAKDYKAQQSEDKKWHCNFFINVPNDDGSEKDGWTKRRFKTIMEAFEESEALIDRARKRKEKNLSRSAGGEEEWNARTG